MADQPTKISFLEKAGYSLGDGAAAFVFQTMIYFQLNYYTDTLGISAAAAGTLLLVGRFWDAIFDPMMGEGPVFTGERLTLVHPIVNKGETAGFIYLESEMQALYSRLTRYAAIAGI